MRSTLSSQLVVSLSIFVSSASAWGWSDHHLITRVALENEPSLKSLEVPVTSLDSLLPHLNEPGKPAFKSVAELNESIQIIRAYNYPFERPQVFGGNDGQVVEHVGGTINAVELLAKYSDEPDWGMDYEIFGEYPELWSESYRFMGGKEGTPSQAPRHMYWPPFDRRHPSASFKFDGGLRRESMGEAHQRASIFIQFARRAKAAGDLYWTLRFVANALHYLEDVSEPFHTTQAPNKDKFIGWVVNPLNPQAFWERRPGRVTGTPYPVRPIDLPLQVTHIVSYYHFSFEDYIARLMGDAWRQQKTGGESSTAKEGAAFRHYLQTPDPKHAQPEDLLYSTKDIDQTVRAMSHLGMTKSNEAGEAAVKFFPKYPNANFYLPLEEKEALNPAWWDQTLRMGAGNSDAKKDYFSVVATMFEPLGRIIRTVVLTEK